MFVPAGKNSYAEATQRAALPTPIFNGPNEATELEAPIRLYIREAALYEKVPEAIPPSGPGGSKTLDDHLFLKWGEHVRDLLFDKNSNEIFMCKYLLFLFCFCQV